MKSKGLWRPVILSAAALALFTGQAVQTIKKPGSANQIVYLRPNITEVRSKCLSYTGELDILGAGFGNTQGTREVIINNKAMSVMIWGNNAIKCSHSYDFPAGTNIKVFLRNTATAEVVSNEFTFFNKYCIYSMTPSDSVPPGTQVEMRVKPAIGTAPLGRVITMGGKPADVVFWNDHTIRAVVPSLSPGNYVILIERHGRPQSNEYPLTVK
jgi:hypothetical protein